MKQVNIHQAKSNLSKLLLEVEKGSEIVLARNGKPIAKIVPFDSGSGRIRKPGSAKGQFKLTDAFFAPLPEDIMEFFYGNLF
ncbi:type II toxin-antitoxin system Phd/YefM family antitoxin [Desulfobacterales bacterium HSG17]|nr:type II toxin-antitoxin system Phd/YefM family antitoxin [Desulfobacterales bacterium HSG17]